MIKRLSIRKKKELKEIINEYKSIPYRTRKLNKLNSILLIKKLSNSFGKLTKRNAKRHIIKIEDYMRVIEINVKKLNLKPSPRNKKKIQQELEIYEKLELFKQQAEELLSQRNDDTPLLSLSLTDNKNIEVDFDKIREKYTQKTEQKTEQKPNNKTNNHKITRKNKHSFDKKLNPDITNDQKLKETSNELIEYLSNNNETDAAKTISLLLSRAYDNQNEDKKVAKVDNSKLLIVNKKILETLQKIQRDMIDEQDTSIKNIARKPKKSSVATNVITSLVKKDKTDTNSGIMDMISNAASAIGTLAAIKAAKSVINKAKELIKIPQVRKTSDIPNRKLKIPKKTSKSLGKLGKMGMKALRFAKAAGPIGLAITAGMALYDGVQGWNNAKENLGLEEGEEATNTQKAASALASIVSGISMGTLDAKNTAQAFNNFIGGNQTIIKYEKMGVINHNSIGYSKVTNWNLFKTLSSKEIQKIININDWSKDDLIRMQQIKIVVKEAEEQQNDINKAIQSAEVANDKVQENTQKENKLEATNVSKAQDFVLQTTIDKHGTKSIINYNTEKYNNTFKQDVQLNDVFLFERKTDINEINKLNNNSLSIIKELGYNYKNLTNKKLLVYIDGNNIKFRTSTNSNEIDNFFTNYDFIEKINVENSTSNNNTTFNNTAYNISKNTNNFSNIYLGSKNKTSNINNNQKRTETYIARNISVSQNRINNEKINYNENNTNNTYNVNNTDVVSPSNVIINKHRKEELTKIISETLRSETIAFQTGVARETITKIIEPLVNNNINISNTGQEKQISTVHDLFSRET